MGHLQRQGPIGLYAATFNEISDAEEALIDMGFQTEGDFNFWASQTAMAFQIMHNKITEAIFDINEEVWS